MRLKNLLGLLRIISILNQSLDINALIRLEIDILCCGNLNAFFVRQDNSKLHTTLAVHLTPAASDIQFSAFELDHPILGGQHLLFRAEKVVPGNVNVLTAKADEGPIIFKVAKNRVSNIRHNIHAVTQVTGIWDPPCSATTILINVKLHLNIAAGNIQHLAADHIAAM